MLLAMLVAAAVSFASTPMVKALACKVGAIDVPKDNRRMHKVPIPRMGGLAIFLAFLLSVLVFADIDRQMQGILLGSIMIVILGVLDDIMALKALPKLFVQNAENDDHDGAEQNALHLPVDVRKDENRQ